MDVQLELLDVAFKANRPERAPSWLLAAVGIVCISFIFLADWLVGGLVTDITVAAATIVCVFLAWRYRDRGPFKRSDHLA